MPITIFDDEGDQVTPVPTLATMTERDKIVERGRRRYAATFPSVYLCGACRNALVAAEKGICDTCDKMFALHEAERIAQMRFPWLAFAVVAVVFALIVTAFTLIERQR